MTPLIELVKQVKARDDFGKAGMILCHNGVVRETSRDGRRVSGLSVEVDWDELVEIVAAEKMRSGIIEILVEINEGQELRVGDDVMYIVVAGDVRETVIEVLSDTLNRIKKSVTSKTEYFLDEEG